MEIMNLCYNLQTCMQSSLQRDLELCAQTGFEAVELNLSKAQAYLEAHSMKQLGELIQASGLRVATINAIFGTSFCDEKKWQGVLDQFHFACELAEVCQCSKVIVLSDEKSNLEKIVTDEEVREDSIRVLHKLADIGERINISIGYEPVGTMVVPNVLIAWDIVKQVNRSGVGIVLDNFNLYLWDLLADVEDIKMIDPDKISIVHINDAENIPFAMLDQNHRCMPGDGRTDVQKYLDCVKACGYDGDISVEVLNPAIWAKGPEVVIPEAYKKLVNVLG